MSQSIVNFLVDNNVDITLANYETQPRIFDFEITGSAQAYYIDLMNQLKAQLQASVPDLPTISKLLNDLNNWSKLRSVMANIPVVDTATGLVVKHITTQTYEINGVPMPVDPKGNVVTLLDGNGALILPEPDVNGVYQIPSDTATPITSMTTPLSPTYTSTIDSTVLNSTMDRYMAEKLDQIIRAFRAAGWDPTSSPDGSLDAAGLTAAGLAIGKITGATTAAIYGLIDAPNPQDPTITLTGLLNKAIGVANQARISGQSAASQSDSLQQILMVDYISRGNELLFNEMGQLRDAIDLNQQALQYLNSLQDLMNQKDPERFILQLQFLNNLGALGTDAQITNVNNFESQSYNQAIGVISRIIGDDPQAISKYLTQQAGVDLGSVQLLQNMTSSTVGAVVTGIKSVLSPSLVGSLTAEQNLAITHLAEQIVALKLTGQTGTGSWGGLSYVDLTTAGSVESVLNQAANSLTMTERLFIINTIAPPVSTPLAKAFSSNLLFSHISDTQDEMPIIGGPVLMFPGTTEATLKSALIDALVNFTGESTYTADQSSGLDKLATRLLDTGFPLEDLIELNLFNVSMVQGVLQQALVDIDPLLTTGEATALSALVGTSSSQPGNLVKAIISRNTNQLYGTFYTLTGSSSPQTIEETQALGEFARLVAGYNGLNLAPNLKSTDTALVQTSLNTILSGASGLFTPAQYTYVSGLLPGFATGIAANNTAIAGSEDSPLSRQAFEDIASSTSTVFNYSKDQIIANLTYLSSQLVAKGGTAGSPLGIAIDKIKADFAGVASINKWIEDSGVTTEGDFQRHITDGLTASQSFNDTQREELSRVMFVFEEFYKSASGLLSRLTQLIEKMASAIAR